jgi:hypothetical protein
MEAAKKFYLVDERTYNTLKTNPWQQAITDKFQEASWSKPPDKRSKNTMHKDMHSILENDELSDDVKAKMYNQGFIRFQNTNKGDEMQPVIVKQEPVHEIATTAKTPKPSTTTKRTKRKRKASKAKAQAKAMSSPPMEWEDLPTAAPQEDEEDERWETVVNKKKKKAAATPVRRSSRPKKVIKWDPIYDA